MKVSSRLVKVFRWGRECLRGRMWSRRWVQSRRSLSNGINWWDWREDKSLICSCITKKWGWNINFKIKIALKCRKYFLKFQRKHFFLPFDDFPSYFHQIPHQKITKETAKNPRGKKYFPFTTPDTNLKKHFCCATSENMQKILRKKIKKDFFLCYFYSRCLIRKNKNVLLCLTRGTSQWIN